MKILHVKLLSNCLYLKTHRVKKRFIFPTLFNTICFGKMLYNDLDICSVKSCTCTTTKEVFKNLYTTNLYTLFITQRDFLHTV